MSTDRDALLTLTLTSGLGPTLTRRAIEAIGSAESVVDAGAQKLARVDGIGPKRAESIRRAIDNVRGNGVLDEEKSLITQFGVRLVALEDENYPPLLRHIPDPPPLLYVRGDLKQEDAVSLAIVGARRCSAYGRQQADRLATLCAQAGLTIVSGGAYGIDVAAHRAAMRIGGRTIAVIGSGLADAYPAKHREVFEEIVGSGGGAGSQGTQGGRAKPQAAGCGAVISELPMRTPPARENFPRRNRIVSGLALGVLVVEASSRSGALITARLCAEDHNREVMAVPGRIDSLTSAGCHRIIREGWATLVTSAADILDCLGETGELLKAGVMVQRDGEDARDSEASSSLFEQNLTDSQRKIVEALSEPLLLDQLAAKTGLAIHVIQADLTMLHIRGVVKREGARVMRVR